MSASPWAVALFIALLVVGHALGFDTTSSTAITWLFLLYVPAWFACSYWWDKHQNGKRLKREKSRNNVHA